MHRELGDVLVGEGEQAARVDVHAGPGVRVDVRRVALAVANFVDGFEPRALADVHEVLFKWNLWGSDFGPQVWTAHLA